MYVSTAWSRTQEVHIRPIHKSYVGQAFPDVVKSVFKRFHAIILGVHRKRPSVSSVTDERRLSEAFVDGGEHMKFDAEALTAVCRTQSRIQTSHNNDDYEFLVNPVSS